MSKNSSYDPASDWLVFILCNLREERAGFPTVLVASVCVEWFGKTLGKGADMVHFLKSYKEHLLSIN